MYHIMIDREAYYYAWWQSSTATNTSTREQHLTMILSALEATATVTVPEICWAASCKDSVTNDTATEAESLYGYFANSLKVYNSHEMSFHHVGICVVCKKYKDMTCDMSMQVWTNLRGWYRRDVCAGCLQTITTLLPLFYLNSHARDFAYLAPPLFLHALKEIGETEDV